MNNHIRFDKSDITLLLCYHCYKGKSNISQTLRLLWLTYKRIYLDEHNNNQVEVIKKLPD